MLFVDRADITAKAGAGGNGCQAFARIPRQRHAPPSGGNGGDGGDVILIADPHLATLLDFQFRHEFRGERGRHGSGNNKTGRRGEDAIVRIPVGTVVTDLDTGRLVGDFVKPNERVVVARGGAGGVGNANIPQAKLAFYARRPNAATSAKPGRPGQQRRLRLELKLIADVGLVGMPNAGKSSLLSRISTARPKVAAYPFTTTSPVLGVVSVGERDSFVACDIPGLIEGAHEGKGLGTQFLRHVERTRLLLHIIDMSGMDNRDPAASYAQVNEELAAHNPVLGRRPQLVVANKMDLPDSAKNLTRFERATGQQPIPISCATSAGIPELLKAVRQRLRIEVPGTFKVPGTSQR